LWGYVWSAWGRASAPRVVGEPMFAGQIALIAAALFAGAALHITLSEHPARLGLDDHAMLAQWKPSFSRAQRMAAPLAILGFALGLLAWWRTGNLGWTYGAILIGANLPYTLILIRPINNRLLATEPTDAGAASRALIVRWGWLHAVRTFLAIAATGALAWASVS
jgi:hypothetical protein